MSSQNRETREVQNPAILKVGQRRDVLIWRQVTGHFRAMDNPNRMVKIGTKGMSDAVMAVEITITPDMVGKTVGVCCFPEFKTLKGTQRDAQKRWQAAAELRGCPYRLVRSPEEMEQFVEDVKSGRW